ncbi:MAG: FecR family protein [Pseudomonadota bacterium]
MSDSHGQTAQASSNTSLLDEASVWIARLSNDQASEQDHQRFALWLGKSAEHRAAYDQMETLWLDLGCVKYTSSAKHDSSPQEDQPMPGQGQITAADKTPRASLFWQKRWVKTRFIASFALCAAVAVSLLPDASRPASTQHLATAVGEHSLQTLSDGSVVQLNTNTRLEVTYSQSQRELSLTQGEAHFIVEKNPQRPFVVRIPGGSVVAVGTAFNIEIEPQQTLVTVTEGVIRVEEQNDSALPADTVTARLNDQVRISPAGGLTRERVPADHLATAWLEQNMVFKNVSLAQVVAEINRYSDKKIKISDASLAFIPVSGVFKTDQPAQTLQAIETSLGLESKAQGNIILLHKRG